MKTIYAVLCQWYDDDVLERCFGTYAAAEQYRQDMEGRNDNGAKVFYVQEVDFVE